MADREIVRTLRQVRRRLMTVRAIESGLRLMLYGAGLAVVAVAVSALAYSILPEWYPYPWAPLALIPLAFVLGLALRLTRPVTLRDAAIYLDRGAGLKERVSTAYELSREGDDSPLAGLVYGQALQICRRFRPRMIKYSRRLRWEVRYLAVALLACGAILFLPPYKTQAVRAREAYEARSRKTAKELKNHIRIIKKEIEADEELQALLKKAEEEADKLARAKMTPARPFADLNLLKGEMKKLQRKREAEKRLANEMKKAKQVDSVRKALDTDPSKTNQGQMKRLADKVAKGRATQAEKSALRRVGEAAEKAGKASGDKALEKAGQNLKNACDSGGGDAEGLAGDMGKIAQAAGQAGGDGGKSGDGGKNAGGDGGRLAAAIDAVERAKQGLAGQGGQPRTASASSGSKQCSTCGGSGKTASGKDCPTCGGSGKQGDGGKKGSGSGQKPGQGGKCSSCSGSGKNPGGGECSACGGTGVSGGGQEGLPGTGSTNLDAPSGIGGRLELENPQAELPWARIYRPRSTAHTKDRKFVPSRLSKGKSAGQITVGGKADPNEEATMDFTGDQEAEQQERTRALEDEHIPAEQRKLVRDYFKRRSN